MKRHVLRHRDERADRRQRQNETESSRHQHNEQLPRNKTSVFYAFKAAAERAGLSKKFRLHDLRHTFAGLFLASGGDIFKLSKILGHSSVAITQQVYAHLHPDAFAEDYSRVSFAMPEQAGVVLKFRGQVGG